ncbi:cytochrome C [Legionella pneumophila subsp. pascullei]|nr:cytochrome C [Legionella pneumophila subsp. pascullei]AMP96558.1 cytochrome C [Legionella pneumophila subsp. pascullei]
MKIKVLLVATLAFLMSNMAFTENIAMENVSVDINDKESLQRGAKMFMNYCSGCHSLKYMRYNRMAQDLGLTTFDGQVAEDLLKNNLIFTQANIYDPIQIAMSPEDAKQWFGMVPPDLSLSARDRGPVWIYNYLKSFYSDPSRPFGANNLLMPDVAMPNVLEPLIGKVILVKNKSAHANDLLVVKRGEMFESQFDSALRDLVNFLVYVGEPAKLIRYKLGVFVLLFFGIFLIAAYSLKKAYWKQLK